MGGGMENPGGVRGTELELREKGV